MKGRTPNERFHAIAAGSPQKRQYKFESLYPAGTLVECRYYDLSTISY
jgi:hypothetical protein